MKLLPQICALILFFLFPVSPVAQAQSTQELPKHLTLAGIGDSVFSAPVIAVMTEAYEQMGIDIEVVRLPAARALAMSSSGAMDGELVRIYEVGTTYPALLRIEPPIHYLDAAVFSLGAPREIDSVESLRPLRIGVILGVKYVDVLFEGQGFDVVKVPTIGRLFEMLVNGRYDVAVVDRFTGWHEVRMKKLKNVFAADHSLVRKPMYHYLHEKNAAIAPLLSQVLAKMRDTGKIERISRGVMDQLD